MLNDRGRWTTRECSQLQCWSHRAPVIPPLHTFSCWLNLKDFFNKSAAQIVSLWMCVCVLGMDWCSHCFQCKHNMGLLPQPPVHSQRCQGKAATFTRVRAQVLTCIFLHTACDYWMRFDYLTMEDAYQILLTVQTSGNITYKDRCRVAEADLRINKGYELRLFLV